VIPAGTTYSVDINAISNLDVYSATYSACGADGSLCTGANAATTLCEAIQNNTLVPGTDLISAFSTYLTVIDPSQFPPGQTQCASNVYAGCMTAPCTLTDATDTTTGLQLAQCTCPTYLGTYQAGLSGQECSLGNDSSGVPLVWSASNTVLAEPTPTQLIAAIRTDLDLLLSFGDLNTGEAHGLGAKAEAAFMIIQKHDNPAGKNILHSMLNDVSALLKSKHISTNTASILSGAISNAIESLR